MKKMLFLPFLLIAFLLLTPVAGQLAPIQVTDNTYFDFDSQIVVDAAGNAYLTWSGQVGGDDFEVFWAKVDTLGTVTIIQITNNTYEDVVPQIAIDSSGNSYIAWQKYDDDAHEYDILWAKVDALGALTTANVTNNSYEDHAPQIAVDSLGTSYITWFEYNGPATEIFWAKVDSTGTVTNTTQVTIDMFPDMNPQIAVDSLGTSYLTWYNHDWNDHEVCWAKVNSSGVITDSIQITTNTYDEYSPQIAIDSSGNSYLTWYGDVDGEDYEVFWAKVDTSGTPTTTQVTTNIYNEGYSQIAVDSLGNSYLTWYGENGEGSEDEVFWAKVNSSGVVTNTAQVIDNHFEDCYPNIALDSLDNSQLTWYGKADGENWEIFWATVDPTGVVTNLTQVTDNNDYNERPKIAVDSLDNIHITWCAREGDYEILITDSVRLATAAPGKPSPFIFRTLANTQLARANSIWSCILEKLPETMPEGFQTMIYEVQTHMANAASLSNPIYSNGELVRAISIMQDIIKSLELDCVYN